MRAQRASIAILGPGGVGGLLAGLLMRAGHDVTVVAREATAALIADQGLYIRSSSFGEFHVFPRVATRLTDAPEVLIVATKATTLGVALQRVMITPPLVMPLLNGLEHVPLLRRRFPPGDRPDVVLAASIRVESDRPLPTRIVHTSPEVRVEMASHEQLARASMQDLAGLLEGAGVGTAVLDSEAQVLWSKLVRLNALACTTSAFALPLGEIRDTPHLRAELHAAVRETAAVAAAEGANVAADATLAELERAHASLVSSMARDIAAGRPCELDAIAGAVLRAAARHHLGCPTVERLVSLISDRLTTPAPAIADRQPPR